jgi:hypothetical protein
MSRTAIDHALKSVREDRDRISVALLDLENHTGYRLLKGARLSGQTRRRWDRAEARLTALWQVFDAYQRVLDDAEALRVSNPRPSEATLRELSSLLHGQAIELPLEEVPLEQRSLLGPTTERLTLDEATERMTTAYSDAIELIASVDGAWERLLGPLDEAEEGWREACRHVQALGAGRNTEVDRIGRELAAVGQLVRTDPLALLEGGRTDTTRLDAVREDLAAIRESLAEAVRLRAEYDERVAGLEASIARLGEVLARARREHETVLVKIDSPGVALPADLTPVLRERLAGLSRLHAGGRWQELVKRMTDLESAAAAALEQAEHGLGLITGLLARRNELRGRLDAYRVKAARLGFAEHDELGRLQEQARALLWSAPCDLRQATAVLAEYQRVLRSLETGTD